MWRILLLLIPVALHSYLETRADFLYWRPTNGGFDYVADETPTSANIDNLRADYHAGFRLGVALSCDCRYVSISGLRFHTTAKARTFGDNMVGAFGAASLSEASGEICCDYWNGELRLGHYLQCSQIYSLHLFGGARYVGIDERRVVSGINRSGNQIRKEGLRFYGAGPLMGVAADLSLLESFSMGGELSGLAIIGERKTHLQSFPLAQKRFVHSTVIIPALSATLQLRICGKRWGVELGYQLDHYWDIFSSLLSFDPEQRVLENSGFAGPYISGRFEF